MPDMKITLNRLCREIDCDNKKVIILSVLNKLEMAGLITSEMIKTTSYEDKLKWIRTYVATKSERTRLLNELKPLFEAREKMRVAKNNEEWTVQVVRVIDEIEKLKALHEEKGEK